MSAPITLISYSLKYGPHPEGLTRKPLDVRNIYNPHRDQALATLTGLDQPVQNALMEWPDVAALIYQLADTLLPSDVFGVRCTHGRHRSVAFVELLASALRKNGRAVTVIHRERDKWEQ